MNEKIATYYREMKAISKMLDNIRLPEAFDSISNLCSMDLQCLIEKTRLATSIAISHVDRHHRDIAEEENGSQN